MKKLTLSFIGSLAIAALWFAGCGQDKPSTAPTNSGGSGDTVLRLYNWDEYISPTVVANFTESTGIKVEIVTFASIDELFSVMQQETDKIDVIVADNGPIKEFRKLRLLAKLDKEKLPNLKNIDPQYLNKNYDPGSKYSVPYTIGTTLLAYRKDKVAVEPTSWSVLWDEKYKGHIYMLDSVDPSINIAMFMDNMSLDASDADGLALIRKRLLDQAPLVGKYADFTGALEGLASGDCWVTPMYSGDAALAAEENDQIGLVIPSEGAPIWIDHFAISRDAKNLDAAHAFINYMLEAEVAGVNCSELWYATPNKAAKPYMDEELLADTTAYPPEEVLKKCRFMQPPVEPELIEFYNQTWSEIKKLRQPDETP